MTICVIIGPLDRHDGQHNPIYDHERFRIDLSNSPERINATLTSAGDIRYYLGAYPETDMDELATVLAKQGICAVPYRYKGYIEYGGAPRGVFHDASDRKKQNAFHERMHRLVEDYLHT